MRVYMKDNFCTIYKLAFHRMQRFLLANDHVIVDTPLEADMQIAGVCAAFDADEDRSSALLGHMVPGTPSYVIGCMVRVRPDKMPRVPTFSAWQHKELLAEIVPQPKVHWEEIPWPSVFRTPEDYRVYNSRKRFVSISLGCAFECSYCPHKLGAGDLLSRSVGEILSQIGELLNQGVETIVLTGIDTASYGKDIGSSLPELLEEILALPGNAVRYHIAQFNPEGIASAEQRAKMARVCSDARVTDLQMPIQTASTRLLKLMERNYTTADVLDLVTRIRQANKGLFLRTDLMVGFPTETDEELAETVAFVSRHFNEVAVYGYEHKKGTQIASSGLPLWDAKTIRARVQEASRQLRAANLLVHSGGQDIGTLIQSDRSKECIRRQS